MNHIYITGILSLIVQILTGTVDIYALTIKVPSSFNLIRELIMLELTVQAIELCFYIWMLSNIHKIKNITPARYYDWAITTPTMLITLMFYLIFLRDREKGVQSGTFVNEFKNHWKVILKVSVLDWLMLLAGYLGEINIFSNITTTLVGFVPFILMFYLIYSNFASQSTEGNRIFWYFAGIWSIYGIAAVLPYKIKNSMYNILDLFAKNFFGLFLAYVVYKHSVKK
jgi:bacteriorhodopsin